MNQKIKQAVKSNFAINSASMKCDSQLEDSVDAALAILEKLTGGENEWLLNLADHLLNKKRYRVKLELIDNYIKLHENETRKQD